MIEEIKLARLTASRRPGLRELVVPSPASHADRSVEVHQLELAPVTSDMKSDMKSHQTSKFPKFPKFPIVTINLGQSLLNGST